ncbi:MAG: hypothetical protein ACXWLL_08385 [Myxococcaceae bacterium]
MKTIPCSLLALLTVSCAHAPPAPAAPPAVTASPGRAEAMAKLSFMRGVWAGPASGTGLDGRPFHVWQTERMGPLLGGDILVVEGRGYRDDDTTGFNAFAVVSYEPRSGQYEIRSYAMGQAGTFPLTPTEDGYVWTIPAGPGRTLRYTAVVKDGVWNEVGDLLVEGKPPVRTFEMTLRRVGDTDWPGAGAVSPRAGR